jgi:hypothetical protein
LAFAFAYSFLSHEEGFTISASPDGTRFLRRAAAQQKVSQADAKYQDQPKEQQRCEICLNFQTPNVCRFVESPISPKGWCQYFAAKENAH